ncbi:MAG: exosortase/archaeosortase family protein [Luteolibacter sp.]
MSSHPSESSASNRRRADSYCPGWLKWVVVLLSAGVVVWFYQFEARYGSGRGESAFRWIYSAWNPETDYEHGLLFPFLIAGLIIYRFKDLKAAAGRGSNWGLLSIFIGVVLYAAAFRTLQPRIAMGALPFILWGSAYYLWGWKVAKIVLFPLFFFWLAVPLPSFQQATTHLQLIATSMAYHGAALCGVETTVQGNMIAPVNGDWKPLEIAAGCSGIRSLMALLMISAAWAYVAKIALWKKILLFLSAFPLAILGNSLRVISIFVIAEYGNAEWARTTWHDWSGLLLFYPFSLLLLLVIHALLEGGLPWRKRHRRTVSRVMVIQPEEVKQS